MADPADASDPLRYRIDGVMDYRRNVGQYTVDLGGLGVPVTVPTVEVVKGLSGLYVRLPEGGSPRSKRWLLLTEQELSEGTGLDSLDETLSAAVYAAVTGIGAMNEMLQAPLEDLATDLAHFRKGVATGRRDRPISPHAGQQRHDGINPAGTRRNSGGRHCRCMGSMAAAELVGSAGALVSRSLSQDCPLAPERGRTPWSSSISASRSRLRSPQPRTSSLSSSSPPSRPTSPAEVEAVCRTQRSRRRGPMMKNGRA